MEDGLNTFVDRSYGQLSVQSYEHNDHRSQAEGLVYSAFAALGVLATLGFIGYAPDISPFAKMIGAVATLLPTIFFIECAQECHDRRKKSETIAAADFKKISDNQSMPQNDNKPMMPRRRGLVR